MNPPNPRTRTLIHATPLRRPFPVATPEAFDEPLPPGVSSFEEIDDEQSATHPHMPNFKDQEPIADVLLYDRHGFEDGCATLLVDVGVVANVSTNPALPAHRIVINVDRGVSLCLTLAQSEALRTRLQFAEMDAAPALVLVGARK